MKFRVTGSNRDTGARMSLEFEADSKGQAERKAEQAGMSVNHAEPIKDDPDSDAMQSSDRPRKRVTGMHPLIRLLILIALVAVVYFYVWPMIRGSGGVGN